MCLFSMPDAANYLILFVSLSNFKSQNPSHAPDLKMSFLQFCVTEPSHVIRLLHACPIKKVLLLASTLATHDGIYSTNVPHSWH